MCFKQYNVLDAKFLRCTKILSQCHFFLFFYLGFFYHVKTYLGMIMMKFKIIIIKKIILVKFLTILDLLLCMRIKI
jgi:hypothetical protein